jgi:hypothetical protein
MASKALLLRLPAAFAAVAIAVSAAQACGPNMGGSSQGGSSQGGSSQGGPSDSGYGQGGGGQRGSWDNGEGERMRQGADDAASIDIEDSGGGRRSSGGDGGGGGQNLTAQITSLGATQGGSQGQAAGQQAGAGGGGGLPPVWCVMQRQGPNGNAEQTVIRCDNTAGAGPGWFPVASNLTFTAASASRDSFNASNPPMVWCLMQRLGPTGKREETVIRCDNMAGAGPGWFPVASNLDFATASAMRESFNASNR